MALAVASVCGISKVVHSPSFSRILCPSCTSQNPLSLSSKFFHRWKTEKNSERMLVSFFLNFSNLISSLEIGEPAYNIAPCFPLFLSLSFAVTSSPVLQIFSRNFEMAMARERLILRNEKFSLFSKIYPRLENNRMEKCRFWYSRSNECPRWRNANGREDRIDTVVLIEMQWRLESKSNLLRISFAKRRGEKGEEEERARYISY